MNKDITYEDVIAVCNKLKKEGKSISAVDVRQVLQSGSYTTIAKHINNWRAKVTLKYDVCSKCQGKGKIKSRGYDLVNSKDIRKMNAIMKKYDLKKYQISKILGISTGAVVGWFRVGTNVQGKIKPVYFELLALKGYK